MFDIFIYNYLKCILKNWFSELSSISGDLTKTKLKTADI